MEGTFLIFNSLARILFDTGATNSFISTSFASILEIKSESIKRPFLVGSPWGSCVEVNQVCRSSTIDILHHKLDCDLLLLDLLDYEVILGMDLLK